MCAALRDSSVLVQRCALDFLLVAFPMHVEVITFSQEDRVEVVTAATSVLLRRDMSLNRRLYSWLCGTSPDSANVAASKSHKRAGSDSSMGEDDASIYFEHYSRALLVDGLRVILQRSLDSEDQPDLRPYRLLTTLLDKPDIGVAILEDVIIDVFRALYHSHQQLTKADQEGDEHQYLTNGNHAKSVKPSPTRSKSLKSSKNF